MRLFDSHCHLDDKSYKNDLYDVLKRARENRIDKMMTVGINERSSDRCVALAENNEGVYASVGVHPHDAKQCSEKCLNHLKTLTKKTVVKAWGETGLDFNRMFSPQKDQEKWFLRQIEISRELNLPVIFHERDSEGRLLDILKESFTGGSGVIHCFSGSKKELTEYLDLGLYIGITGVITILSRGEDLRKLAVYIPDDRVLVETDAPYLTPAPEKNRQRRNEPAFVRSVFEKLAEVKGRQPEDLAETVWQNTCRLFRI